MSRRRGWSSRASTAPTARVPGGATWLQVSKASGPSDHRPVVTETDGPDWGYHVADVNLALGDLVADAAAAEASWSKARPRAIAAAKTVQEGLAC